MIQLLCDIINIVYAASVIVAPSVADNLIKVNILNKDGGKTIITISNLTSAIAV